MTCDLSFPAKMLGWLPIYRYGYCKLVREGITYRLREHLITGRRDYYDRHSNRWTSGEHITIVDMDNTGFVEHERGPYDRLKPQQTSKGTYIPSRNAIPPPLLKRYGGHFCHDTIDGKNNNALY